MDLSKLFKDDDQFDNIPEYEKVLKQQKLATDSRDIQMYARFMYAVDFGSAADMKTVIGYGANPDFVLPRKETALGRAADSNRVDLADVLLNAGADPMAKSSGKLPLDIALQRGAYGIILRLLDAISPEKLDYKKLGTALVSAAFDNIDLVRRLLDAGVPVDTPASVQIIPGARKTTALMTASYAGQTEICKVLLGAGADINAKDSKGHTALDYARLGVKDKVGKKVTVGYLEKQGAASSAPVEIPHAGVDLSEEASAPAFKKLLENLATVTKKKPKPLDGMDGPISGGYGFPMQEKRARDFVAKNHDDFLKQGAYLFYTSDLMGMSGAAVAVLPTADALKAVEAMQTEGPNEDVYNKDLLQWLRKLMKQEDIIITGIGYDFLEAEFRTPVKNPSAMAERIAKICSEAGDSPEELKRSAERLAREQKFFLWWD